MTRFTDFDVKTMDSGAGSIVFEQAGYIHELDPKSGKERLVNITATGDFPWMMPRWDDVSNRLTNLSLSPTGKRLVVEARGEVFTIPTEKVTCATSPTLPVQLNVIQHGRPTENSSLISATSPASIDCMLKRRMDSTPPREIALDKPTHYYTPVLVAGFKEASLYGYRFARLGSGRGDRQSKNRRQRSMDGADPHAQSGLES